MDEKPDSNSSESATKPSSNQLKRIRQSILEAAAFIFAVDPFETAREMAIKGYTDVLGQRHPPMFTPPEGSPWYHVGDLWDGYFYTAVTYWALTAPALLLPERYKFHGRGWLSPENIRLAVAFSAVIAGVIITEIQDPSDIPAGILGATVFIALHLSTEKIAPPLEKAGARVTGSLSELASKISTLLGTNKARL